jgi:hypothetical protein
MSGRVQVDSATFDALREFPARLERFYAAIPPDAGNWRPDSWHGIPSEPFTPLEQLCHVRDIEIDGYHARFARMLRENEPVLANIDGEALARERNYAGAGATQVLAQFRDARARTLAAIETFTPEQLQRRAFFDGAHTTLRGLVHLLCSHDQQHLSGLQWLLARIDATRATAG